MKCTALSKWGILKLGVSTPEKEYKLENVTNTIQLIKEIVKKYFLSTDKGFVVGITEQPIYLSGIADLYFYHPTITIGI